MSDTESDYTIVEDYYIYSSDDLKRSATQLNDTINEIIVINNSLNRLNLPASPGLINSFHTLLNSYTSRLPLIENYIKNKRDVPEDLMKVIDEILFKSQNILEKFTNLEEYYYTNI